MADSRIEGLSDLGFRMEDIIKQEHDAALGNGGLGRLAACFLDSLASLNYPAWGYGLRYRYGIFKQEIIDGYQVEVPDYWLDFNPWEFQRHDVTVDIQFYGHVDRWQYVHSTLFNLFRLLILAVGMRMAKHIQSGLVVRSCRL